MNNKLIDRIDEQVASDGGSLTKSSCFHRFLRVHIQCAHMKMKHVEKPVLK